MIPRTKAVWAVGSILMVGCGVSSPSKIPSSNAAAASTGKAGDAARQSAKTTAVPDAFALAPHPARSVSRLRALLRNVPRALAVMEGPIAKIQGFDLEQPAYAVLSGKAFVFSMGVGRELAETLRANPPETCSVLEIRNNLRFACAREGKPDADLARVEPPHSSGTDAHFEIGGATLRDLMKEKGGTRFAGSAAHDTDRFDSIDRVSMDLNLEGAPELRLGWHVTGQNEMMNYWLDAPVAPPPSSFSQLPVDSEFAFFGHAPPSAASAPLKKLVLDKLAEKKRNECLAKHSATLAKVGNLFFTGGSFVGAVGVERAKAEAAAESLSKAPADKKKLAAAKTAMNSWFIWGAEEPAARWTEALAPLDKIHCNKKDGSKRSITVNRKLNPRLGLPEGSLELAIIEKDSRRYFFVAPDRTRASRTWVVGGHDRAVLIGRLKGILAGPSGIAMRPGLAPLQAPASVGAFATPAGIAWLLADEKTDEDYVAEARALLKARDLPTGGRTPITFRMRSAHDTKGKGGETSVHVSLDAAAIGDIASLTME